MSRRRLTVSLADLSRLVRAWLLIEGLRTDSLYWNDARIAASGASLRDCLVRCISRCALSRIAAQMTPNQKLYVHTDEAAAIL